MMKDIEIVDVLGIETISITSDYNGPTCCLINENRVFGNKVLKYKNIWATVTVYVYDGVIHRDDGPAIISINHHIDSRQLYNFYYHGVQYDSRQMCNFYYHGIQYNLSDYVEIISKIDIHLASMVLLTYG